MAVSRSALKLRVVIGPSEDGRHTPQYASSHGQQVASPIVSTTKNEVRP